MLINNERYAVFSRYFRSLLTVVTCLLLLVIVIGTLIALTFGIDSQRMIYVFSNDEASQMSRIMDNISLHRFPSSEGWFFYGYFYNVVVIFICKIYQALTSHMSFYIAAFTARFVSFSAYVGSSVTIYYIVKYFEPNKKLLAFLAAATLLVIAPFNKWASAVHPDIFQALLIILAVLVIVKHHSVRGTYLAVFIAGLAFGTKYAGIFLWPFLMLPVLITLNFNGIEFFKSLRFIGVSLIVFVCGWLFFNPYVLIQFHAFISQLSTQSHYLKYDVTGLLSFAPFEWFSVFKNSYGFFLVLFLCTLPAFLFITLLYDVCKNGLKKILSDKRNVNILLLFFYVFFMMFYIGLFVYQKLPRYTFPFLLAWLILAYIGVGRIQAFFDKPWLDDIIYVLLFVLMLLTISFSGITTGKASSYSGNLFSYLKYRTLIDQNPHLIAGKYLSQHYPVSIKIQGDAYTYVPAQFKNVTLNWGLDSTDIKANPDIIVINRIVTGRYCWKKPNTKLEDGAIYTVNPNNIDSPHYCSFLRKFVQNMNKDWKIVYETYDVVILQNKQYRAK